MRADAQGWAGEAERGQRALDAHFTPWRERLGARLRLALPFGGRSPRPGGSGRLRNTSPWRWRQAFDFNYWWLAHAVEVRVDAFERSGDPARLDQAQAVYARILRRNHGLFNDYFDDMGWLCLGAIRLADATGEQHYLSDAEALWEHIASRGWNATHGPSVSWRVQQPEYKNAPSNGAFALASLRLHARTGEPRFRERGEAALDWMRARLVDERSLVLDGIGRTGGDDLDRDWIFSYNQGLLIGALTEQFDRTGDPALLAEAARTAEASIRLLASSGVVTGETARLDARGGGDAGLFKGIFFRHLEALLERVPDAAPGSVAGPLVPFFVEATDRLEQHLHPDGATTRHDVATEPAGATTRPTRHDTVTTRPTAEASARRGRQTRIALAGDDWSRPAPRVTALATELSAVMTLEARARWEARRAGAARDEGGAGPTA